MGAGEGLLPPRSAQREGPSLSGAAGLSVAVVVLTASSVLDFVALTLVRAVMQETRGTLSTTLYADPRWGSANVLVAGAIIALLVGIVAAFLPFLSGGVSPAGLPLRYAQASLGLAGVGLALVGLSVLLSMGSGFGWPTLNLGYRYLSGSDANFGVAFLGCGIRAVGEGVSVAGSALRALWTR